jgi:lipoate-protein ligase A
MPNLRVLFDPAAGGAWNMAVDEALLARAAASGQPTLRFYTWQEATLSLGYFQAAGHRQQHAASQKCPLVRRSTGGGAILHDHELTYSLIMPGQASAAAARRLYELVHGSLIEVLRHLGIAAALFRDVATCETSGSQQEPFLCFERRTCFDVVIDRHKIAGSAQRRRGQAVLQHGSILLARSPGAPELPGIHELSGTRLPASDLAATWSDHLTAALGLASRRDALTADERAAAAEFVSTRFGAPSFTERR